jgi:acyl carrier protein
VTNEAPSAAVEAAVFEAFVRVMGQTPPRGAETEARDVESWTSLTNVHLIAEIEGSLGVELPMDLLVSMGPLSEIVRAASAGAR